MVKEFQKICLLLLSYCFLISYKWIICATDFRCLLLNRCCSDLVTWLPSRFIFSCLATSYHTLLKESALCAFMRFSFWFPNEHGKTYLTKDFSRFCAAWMLVGPIMCPAMLTFSKFWTMSLADTLLVVCPRSSGFCYVGWNKQLSCISLKKILNISVQLLHWHTHTFLGQLD